MNSNEPLILGHRGASAIAPENTLAAFSQAIRDGADGIEFDVRLSSDGVPVVIHDATLDRTGLISGTVGQLTAAQLQQIDVGRWFDKRTGDQVFSERLPTLAQVFDLFATNNAVLYVEMKCDANEGARLASAVVRQISQQEMRDRVVVESFALSAILEVKRIDSRVRTAALFEPRLAKPVSTLRSQSILKLARNHQADEIAIHHSLGRSKLLHAARAEGFEVVVWTCDDPDWIARARHHQVKALIANNPRRMVEVRDESSRQSVENSPR